MPQLSSIHTECLEQVVALLDLHPGPVALINEHYEIIASNSLYQEAYNTELAGRVRHCYEVSHHYSRPCHEMGESCPMYRCATTGEVQRSLHLHHTPHGQEHVDVKLYPVVTRGGDTLYYLETFKTLKTGTVSSRDQKLIGKAPSFLKMLELVNLVAGSDSPVALLGESGTGKELVSLAIHRLSKRKDGPFVPVDCSGLTETLFESELFGHEKGAFTGAHSRKLGLVESARGGTLFLDEVGDIPLSLQVKLLRLLETGSYRRVGSTEPQQAEFRLVCATHRDLQQMIREGEFRQDLYYRISAFPIELPSLRQRREDIPRLVKSFLKQYPGKKTASVTDSAMQVLRTYDYPGNIRELRNIIDRAQILAAGGNISAEHLPGIVSSDVCASDDEVRFSHVLPLDVLEKKYLCWALHHYKGDRKQLAKALGLGERTLYRKLEKLNSNCD